MSNSYEKLARILRIEPQILEDLDSKMSAKTGKSEVIDKIAEENDLLMNRTLEELGVSKDCAAKDVYSVLVKRLKDMDEHLFNFLEMPDLSQLSIACGKLCDIAMKLNGSRKGFFIKKEKATEMLEKFPPQNILNYFGYKTARELVEVQGFSSVFSALRFAQSSEWMHKFFDEAYNSLTADDFEERDVELKILETEWLDVAEKFLEKKYHNVSHLKEFGIIFVVPLKIDTPGETLRMFTLILHYLNEVPFYSKLFKNFAGDENFAEKLKSLLRGDVLEIKNSKLKIQNEEADWLIIQRYLAKDDENDPRLFMPHINPEAEHWYKAGGDLAKISQIEEVRGHVFGYWQGLDFVGDFFKNGMDSQPEELVSFDLIDLVMSLVKKDKIKYLYHQQEALWNKIFIEYFGREKMNDMIDESIINGFIKL